MRFSEQERKTMKEFFRNISFTKSEVRVILFLTAVLTSGFAIKYYRQVVAGSVVKNYDYKGTDEEFKRLSDNFNHRIATEDSGKSTENIEIADTSLISEMAASEDSLNSLKVIPAGSGGGAAPAGPGHPRHPRSFPDRHHRQGRARRAPP